MPNDDKVRELRLRRTAERQGLRLVKSRRRDPHALGYGTYGLVDAASGDQVAAADTEGFGMTLDAVERVLKGAPGGR